MAMLIEEHKRLRRNEVGEFLARIEKYTALRKTISTDVEETLMP